MYLFTFCLYIIDWLSIRLGLGFGSAIFELFRIPTRLCYTTSGAGDNERDRYTRYFTEVAEMLKTGSFNGMHSDIK
jgi:hypothetical protein